jgi:phosphoglycolate phosphatase
MELDIPTAILWDWDNTLADNWASLTAAINVVFARFDMPEWTVDESRARMRLSMAEAFPTLFGADSEAAQALFLSSFDALHLSGLVAMPGVEAALEAGSFCSQAVVSNKPAAHLRREVTHIGWSAYFRAVIGAGDTARGKPDPEPIWHTLQLMGIAPGRSVWYVGDNETDMLAAHAAGCKAVLLGGAAPDKFADSLDLCSAAPHLHYASGVALAARLRQFATG